MTHPAAALPEARSELVAYLLSEGPTLFDISIRQGRMPVRPAGDIHAAACELARLEAQRVHKGELYWINGDMTDLAAAAARSMPAFTLAPEDLPSPWGFMAFERPICVRDDETGGTPMPVIAASWGPWAPPAYTNGGVWVTWYTDPEAVLSSAEASRLSPQALAMVRSATPPFTLDCESMAPFTQAELPRLDSLTGQAATDGSLGVELLKVVWLLMTQPLARTVDVAPDRAVRKRLARVRQEAKPVRVIELRRPARSEEVGKGNREYHHAWVVRGHWRQHWYPKRQVHRPVWIAPHIKGPEGAPLLGGEKVYALKR